MLVTPSVFALPTTVTKIVFTPPTTFNDGTPITTPVTYRTYCRNDELPYTDADIVYTGTETIFELNLITTKGNWECHVSSEVNGIEGGHSGPVNFTYSGGHYLPVGPNPPSIKLI